MFSNYSQIELRVLAALANKQLEAMREDAAGMGEATDLRCHCGGVMHKFDPTRAQFEKLQKEMGKPRYSRRKRQAKKNHRKWRESQGSKMFLAAALARPLRNPMGFRCAACGAHEGFYGMMARSMFKIEPLPPGAKAVY